MKTTILFSIVILALNSIFAMAADQKNIIVRITAQAGEHERFDTPVSVALDDLTGIHESELGLYEITGEKLTAVPVQFTARDGRRMHWLLSGHTGPGESRLYSLVHEQSFRGAKTMKVEKAPGEYVLFSGEKPVLQYNSGIVNPPGGADQAYRRSGFIHPLYSPDGTPLTAIQPPDHIHHYGIWNPWTKTTFRGQEIDFWNLAKGEGTVRFSGMASVHEGPVFGGVRVLHEHIAWPGSRDETIAMNELQEIRVYDRQDGSFMVDITSSLSPAEKLILEEYRYGGFVFRATDQWTNETSDFYTSRGLDRDHADGQRAEWCVVTGKSRGGTSGLLMMGYPSNYNHPEPLRVWPSDANRNRGDVFINFSPTRNTRWVLEPGTDYLLRYRIIVFEDTMDREKAAMLWNDFSSPPVITLEKPSAFPLVPGKWDNRTGKIEGTRLLVYTKVGDDGFVHTSIPAGVRALEKLAREKGFAIDVTRDPSVFNDENLKKYHAIVFNNTNNDVFDNDDQRLAFMRYVQAGGGFVGIHIAIGTERNWKWYKQMSGATFDRHPRYQEMNVNIRDPLHPSARHLPDPWTIKDEPYFLKEYNPDVRVIMTHDLATIEDDREKPEIFGNDYPSVWCNTFDGGRQWYTAYGHDDHIFEDELFIGHILGGIKWVIADGLPDYRNAYSISVVR